MHFSCSASYGRFLSASGRFHNMHGKEYRGGGFPFPVDTMKQKVWTIFPYKGKRNHSNMVTFVKN